MKTLLSARIFPCTRKPIIKRCRSSRPEVFCKKGILKNFVKFTRKHLCRSLIFIKVAGLTRDFIKRLRHRCFPVNFAKLLRTPFLEIPSLAASDDKF